MLSLTLSPVAPEAARPSVTVTPLLGADRRLHRLGKGKGYYDRYFAKLQTYKVGLAFKEQVIALYMHMPPSGKRRFFKTSAIALLWLSLSVIPAKTAFITDLCDFLSINFLPYSN